jgi:hydrogenase maturation factor
MGRLSQEKTQIRLVLRSLKDQGRDGSYMGLMFTENRKEARLFLVDPAKSYSNYVLIPVGINPEGWVSIENATPSMTLDITEYKKKVPKFVITNSNAGNSFGFLGKVEFNLGFSDLYSWGSLEPGKYEASSGKSDIVVGVSNTELETNVNFSLISGKDYYAGDFVFVDTVFGAQRIDQVLMLDTGFTRQPMLRWFALFINKGKSKNLLLVNPISKTDLRWFEKN